MSLGDPVECLEPVPGMGAAGQDDRVVGVDIPEVTDDEVLVVDEGVAFAGLVDGVTLDRAGVGVDGK